MWLVSNHLRCGSLPGHDTRSYQHIPSSENGTLACAGMWALAVGADMSKGAAAAGYIEGGLMVGADGLQGPAFSCHPARPGLLRLERLALIAVFVHPGAWGLWCCGSAWLLACMGAPTHSVGWSSSDRPRSCRTFCSAASTCGKQDPSSASTQKVR
jgi:hypothetical protein